MAYINAEEVKAIRVKLKEVYPNIKFSVTKRHHSVVVVSIMKSDIDFSEILDDRGDVSINPYYTSDYGSHSNMFEHIVHICKTAPYEDSDEEWFDKSDSMSDYFHVSYYIDISIGKWNKPYEMVK